MNERSITIKEIGGGYQISESDFGKFELLGLLEQIVFDLKNVAAKTEAGNEEGQLETVMPAEVVTSETVFVSPTITVAATAASVAAPIAAAPTDKPVATPPTPPKSAVVPATSVGVVSDELRARLGNAVKAISELGGATETADYGQMSKAELQAELDALTGQYKRLKASKAKK